MFNQKKFIVSHAPFWHNGSTITERNYHTMLAALPALLVGIFQYGAPALGVACLSISSAMLWELGFNRVAKQPASIGDGNAALIGMLFAMMLPATVPWWFVLTGTFVAVIICKMIFGGIGGNVFNPVALTIAILLVSWKSFLDFDGALVGYNFDFFILYPLGAAKYFGTAAVDAISAGDLLMGKQVGGIGATCGIALILGGAYLIFRGFIRWEISLSFLLGVIITALFFNVSDSAKYAGPALHLFSGYTLIGALFLATEDSSSPVNFVPMLIYGVAAGVMTVLIRNLGMYVDGVVFAILVVNLVNPLLDKIRPKALGKVA